MEQYYKYSRKKYDFEELLSEFFDVYDLKQLHRFMIGSKKAALFSRETDSATVFHQKFYDKLRAGWPEFETMYSDFVREVVAPLFPEEKVLIYQKTPTFRVQLPENVAVGAFHRDGDYFHPKGEVNFIIPVNSARDSACTITESEPGKMDFHQLSFKPGRLIRFSGNDCLHGNIPNLTGKTRVSLDFRVLPREHYKPEEAGMSVTRGTKFAIGHYYTEMEIGKSE